MNKYLAFVCCSIAGVGVVLLGSCTFLTITYGHGNVEAGNFHRCRYWTERDMVTGAVKRCWDTDWALVSSTDGAPWAEFIDMWFVGICFVVIGAGIYAAGWQPRHG